MKVFVMVSVLVLKVLGLSLWSDCGVFVTLSKLKVLHFIFKFMENVTTVCRPCNRPTLIRPVCLQCSVQPIDIYIILTSCYIMFDLALALALVFVLRPKIFVLVSVLTTDLNPSLLQHATNK